MARNRWNLEEEEDAPEVPVLFCWLCEREMGEVTEWHHPVPKSRGGRDKVPLHPICHQAIHTNFTNAELGRSGDDLIAIRTHSVVAKFLEWIAKKPVDFHVPTHSDKGRGGRR